MTAGPAVVQLAANGACVRARTNWDVCTHVRNVWLKRMYHALWEGPTARCQRGDRNSAQEVGELVAGGLPRRGGAAA